MSRLHPSTGTITQVAASRRDSHVRGKGVRLRRLVVRRILSAEHPSSVEPRHRSAIEAGISALLGGVRAGGVDQSAVEQAGPHDWQLPPFSMVPSTLIVRGQGSPVGVA